MPALKKTEIVGKITWLGKVTDREASLRSEPLDRAFASFAGFEKDSHSGVTRASCSRVVQQYSRGTEIRNVRQFCLVSAEEMQAIAEDMGTSEFDPGWCGASIVISGIPDFTHIPPSSRLQTQEGTTLTVDMENRPCHLPAAVIDADHPGLGKAFKSSAKDRRGVTAWVEREGWLEIGGTVTLHIPVQRAWRGPT